MDTQGQGSVAEASTADTATTGRAVTGEEWSSQSSTLVASTEEHNSNGTLSPHSSGSRASHQSRQSSLNGESNQSTGEQVADAVSAASISSDILPVPSLTHSGNTVDDDDSIDGVNPFDDGLSIYSGSDVARDDPDPLDWLFPPPFPPLFQSPQGSLNNPSDEDADEEDNIVEAEPYSNGSQTNPPQSTPSPASSTSNNSEWSQTSRLFYSQQQHQRHHGHRRENARASDSESRNRYPAYPPTRRPTPYPFPQVLGETTVESPVSVRATLFPPPSPSPSPSPSAQTTSPRPNLEPFAPAAGSTSTSTSTTHVPPSPNLSLFATPPSSTLPTAPPSFSAVERETRLEHTAGPLGFSYHSQRTSIGAGLFSSPPSDQTQDPGQHQAIDEAFFHRQNESQSPSHSRPSRGISHLINPQRSSRRPYLPPPLASPPLISGGARGIAGSSTSHPHAYPRPASPPTPTPAPSLIQTLSPTFTLPQTDQHRNPRWSIFRSSASTETRASWTRESERERDQSPSSTRAVYEFRSTSTSESTSASASASASISSSAFVSASIPGSGPGSGYGHASTSIAENRHTVRGLTSGTLRLSTQGQAQRIAHVSLQGPSEPEPEPASGAVVQRSGAIGFISQPGSQAGRVQSGRWMPARPLTPVPSASASASAPALGGDENGGSHGDENGRWRRSLRLRLRLRLDGLMRRGRGRRERGREREVESRTDGERVRERGRVRGARSEREGEYRVDGEGRRGGERREGGRGLRARVFRFLGRFRR